MAGIGFELKKLFSRKGLVATIRAYGYAAMVTAGPMILGFLLLLSAMFLADLSGAPRHDRELLVSMLTHALLASLTVTSLFSMLTTRFCADMIYEKRYDAIAASFYGSLSLMLVLGGLGYGIFLYFSGVKLLYQVLSFLFFMVLVVVWTEINYLTMLKDYRSIIVAFAVSLAVALLLGILFIWVFHIEAVAALMAAVIIGYGVMMLWYFFLINRYFPEGFGTSMRFLAWFDTTPQLGFTGFFVTLGLFGHLVIMWWASPLQVQVEGLFYGAPTYDVPAIFAFFSILTTTVNFVTSVETRFYPRYKEYFSLFNDGGSIENLNEAEDNMLRVLSEELGYLALKQLFSTLLFIILGTILLPQLPLGFNSEMLRIYRTLCVGYAFYAVGNSVMLVSQYFSDMGGALLDSAVFAVTANAASLLLARFCHAFYGFGFLIGSAVFCLTAWLRLCAYLRKLKYNVLSRQPMLDVRKAGLFTRMSNALEGRAARVQRRRKAYEARAQEKAAGRRESAQNEW